MPTPHPASAPVLEKADLEQLKERGISVDEVQRQVQLLTEPRRFVPLERACTVGNGIERLTDAAVSAAAASYARARRAGRIAKFVPASGAASRMFQSLLAAQALCAQGRPSPTPSGDASLRDVRAFLDAFPRFAFADDLRALVRAAGGDADDLARRGDAGEILDCLLSEHGLNYAVSPKALIKFHQYPEGGRTAFEEHLADATRWVGDAAGVCRVHFTVAPEHRHRFEELARAAGRHFERTAGVRYEVGFSEQKPSSDTIAVDGGNHLFRAADGALLFRPGGHGALIQNVNDLRGDIVFIENIDNIVPDRLKDVCVKWKSILTGHLLVLQQTIFGFLERLAAESVSESTVHEMMDVARRQLGVSVPDALAAAPLAQRRAFLRERLDRPLRVCGMVRNEGEPGGGPFWVRGNDETLTPQIVESAQVDPDASAQQSIFSGATHFNPVQLACGVRDWRGQPFDLARYVDESAVFIAHKSSGGRELKALERPGLWNGAMANWTTVFVEIPADAFNPVKTVLDLLRPAHQPEGDPGAPT